MGAQPDPSAPARSAPWQQGSVIGKRYRLVAPLGAGAMGQVWRAVHLTLASPVAVKLVDLEAQADPQEALGRFLQEARAVAKLKSPHVVQIIDHGASGRIAYIAMELLEGESLAARLARQRRLAPEALVKLVRGMALGIDRAHKTGILHRDLKPANIFFALGEEGEVVKVLDFGIAKVVGETKRDAFVETQVGLVMGTPAYMSPEQVLGRPLDARSDLWQLGVIAHECLCGSLPFHGATVGEVFLRICSGPMPIPSATAPVPASFDAWFARALQRDRRLRFSSALELSEALERALEPALEPPITPPAGTPDDDGRAMSEVRSAAASSRRALWLGVTASVALTSAALAIVAMIARSGAPAQSVAEPPRARETAEARPAGPATDATRALVEPSASPAAPADSTPSPASSAEGSARPAPGPAPQPDRRSPTTRVVEDLGI